MNKRIFLSVALFFIISLFVPEKGYAMSGRAKLTIKVVNEQGQPVEGASVGVGFQYDKTWATGSNSVKGLTDDKGLLSVSERTNGHVGFRVTKKGYYKSTQAYDYKEKGLAGWKPWNPELEVVLRKVENPVPMYARDLRKLLSPITIPEADKELGFDLVEFDWVTPYGRGITPDFIFYLTMTDNGLEDYEYNLKVLFSNEFDGIQEFQEDILHGSKFKLRRLAPVGGYNKEINIFMSGLKRGSISSWNKNRHHIFRLRSEEEHGKLKRAIYGKILSDIEVLSVRGSKLPGIFFKYYLNPDYTRNLEFDPEQNLFNNLPDREQVGI